MSRMIAGYEDEWVSGIEYKNRISQFLNEIDQSMCPILSERVDIDAYANKLSENAETLFIMWNDEDIASCSVYCNKEIAFLSSIAVKDEYQNSKIGSKMIAEMISHIKKKACTSLELEVFDQNEKAIRFYERLGFKCIRNMDHSMILGIRI